MLNEPRVVDWQITNKCTRTCPFCYGPRLDEAPISFDDCIRLVEQFVKLGCQIVGITGGEPLTHPRIDSLLQYLKSKRLVIGLNSNCDLYWQHRDTILSTVDALEIPLEAGSVEIHDAIRGRNSFQAVIGALTDSYRNSRIVYRIGTVLTSTNAHELASIERVLAAFGDRIMYWKIYEYIAYSNKEMNDSNEDHLLFEQIRTEAPYQGLGQYLAQDQIIFDSASARSRSYLLVRPNGTAFVPVIEDEESSEREVGNLLTDDASVTLANWNREVRLAKYTACVRCIFRADRYKYGYAQSR